jgi:hypothetical protein
MNAGMDPVAIAVSAARTFRSALESLPLLTGLTISRKTRLTIRHLTLRK